ncbi:MAG: Uma2 family endonuclease [bacterium]|nr:Uma2 family endonuclease [bacterium]
MAETALVPAVDEMPDISHIVTEDHTPVDNLFSAKQQRLLVEPLYSSWKPGRSFIADANVGVFALHETPVVPDMFLSLDVQTGEDWWAKENRSYFVWKHGKPPEIAVEVVSNTVGEETGNKFRKYARIGVLYYVIFDPQELLQDKPLTIYELHRGRYVPLQNLQLAKVGLSMMLWDGMFEGKYAQWLRWCDLKGRVIPTGLELSVLERRFADQESQRAERLAEKLKALGISVEE